MLYRHKLNLESDFVRGLSQMRIKTGQKDSLYSLHYDESRSLMWLETDRISLDE